MLLVHTRLAFRRIEILVRYDFPKLTLRLFTSPNTRSFHRMNTNLELYNSIKEVSENGDSLCTEEYSSMDNFVTQLFIDDFEKSGIHLDEAKVSSIILFGVMFLILKMLCSTASCLSVNLS